METIKVKDLMVPLDEYAVVTQKSTLHDAVVALEKAQEGFKRFEHKHRAILVVDEKNKVIGSLSMHDVLMSLEPKYGGVDQEEMVSRYGYSLDFLQSMLRDNVLWNEPLKFICNRATGLKVSNIMRVPEEGMYIDENATLGEAVHQLVLPKQQSLLVTRDDEVVGVLRLSDVFSQICDEIKACKI
jgi:CBS domain-containing protein